MIKSSLDLFFFSEEGMIFPTGSNRPGWVWLKEMCCLISGFLLFLKGSSKIWSSCLSNIPNGFEWEDYELEVGEISSKIVSGANIPVFSANPLLVDVMSP